MIKKILEISVKPKMDVQIDGSEFTKSKKASKVVRSGQKLTMTKEKANSK